MSFTVTLKGSGERFTVPPGRTLLEAALAAGRRFPYGCRTGSCGSCKGRVLEGEVDHGGSEEGVLTPAERAAGWALFCQARPLGDLLVEVREVASPPDIEVRTLPARVARMERLAHDVMGLWLQLPASERLHYLAGQYVDILLPGGRTRSFSLANPPGEGGPLELHVRRQPGGLFSGQVFERMKERDLLRLRGPLGTFFLRPEGGPGPLVMMAGGTGFAPIKAMLGEALARGLARPVKLYCGVRALRDLYMDGLARAWAARHPGLIDYVPVLSEPGPEDGWTGRRGWVHAAVCEDLPDLSGAEVYMSGPPPMIHAARAAFAARGLAADRLFYDAFEAAPA